MMKDVIEVRTVKVSSKRQFAIPKSIMDELKNPDQFKVILTKKGLLLEPIYEEEE